MLIYSILMLFVILAGSYLGWWSLMQEEEIQAPANTHSQGWPQAARESFEIGTDQVNQLFRALPFIRSRFGAKDMVPNMPFDHLIHQSINGATRCGDQLQEVGAFVLGIQRVFNGFHLAAYPPDTGQ